MLVLVPFVVGIVLFAVIRFGIHAPGEALRRRFVRGSGRPGSQP